MSPRRPTPDPMEVAHALADRARSANGDERRVLVATARMKLDEANAGLADNELALQGQSTAIADQMRRSINKRRSAIQELSEQLDAIERVQSGGNE